MPFGRIDKSSPPPEASAVVGEQAVGKKGGKGALGKRSVEQKEGSPIERGEVSSKEGGGIFKKLKERVVSKFSRKREVSPEAGLPRGTKGASEGLSREKSALEARLPSGMKLKEMESILIKCGGNTDLNLKHLSEGEKILRVKDELQGLVADRSKEYAEAAEKAPIKEAHVKAIERLRVRAAEIELKIRGGKIGNKEQMKHSQEVLHKVREHLQREEEGLSRYGDVGTERDKMKASLEMTRFSKSTGEIRDFITQYRYHLGSQKVLQAEGMQKGTSPEPLQERFTKACQKHPEEWAAVKENLEEQRETRRREQLIKKAGTGRAMKSYMAFSRGFPGNTDLGAVASANVLGENFWSSHKPFSMSDGQAFVELLGGRMESQSQQDMRTDILFRESNPLVEAGSAETDADHELWLQCREFAHSFL